MTTSPDIAEFDLAKANGWIMKGWDFSSEEVASALAHRQLLNPAMELASNVCPWNCAFCFTEDPSNPIGVKKRAATELPLARRLELIDEVAALGARSVNVVGAGEPTIEAGFWQIAERIASAGMVPIIYTEGSLRLVERKFADRLHRLGATVVLKVNSLWNATWQNSVVTGPAPSKSLRRRGSGYSELRNQALDHLISAGFAVEVPTRLGFDTIACRHNLAELLELHRYCRNSNIFMLLVGYLPTGRSHAGTLDELTREELFDVFDKIADFDKTHFGLSHRSVFPYGGGTPCTIRGVGLHVKIDGRVFDCSGESVLLGNVSNHSLAEIWQRADQIRSEFDGQCKPRRDAWIAKAQAQAQAKSAKRGLTQLRLGRSTKEL